jgi:hypothetical protein
MNTRLVLRGLRILQIRLDSLTERLHRNNPAERVRLGLEQLKDRIASSEQRLAREIHAFQGSRIPHVGSREQIIPLDRSGRVERCFTLSQMDGDE